MRLFYRLLIVLLGIGIAPLLPAGALMLYYQHRAENTALQLHEGLARVTSISVSQYISGLGGRMAFSRDLERALDAGSKSSAKKTIEQAVAANPDFLLVAVLDKNGREIMRAGKPEMVARYNTVNAASSPLFARSVKTDEVVIGEFGSYDGGPGGLLFFPLDNGKTIFVNVSFNSLWSQIYSQRFGNTGYIFLSSDDGRIFQVKDDIPPPVNPDFLKIKYLTGQRGTLKSIPTKYGTFVGAFEHIPGTTMSVLTLQLKKEAFWAIQLTVWLTIFFLLVIITCAYFGALWLAARISEPVEQLKLAADRVKSHNFKQPVKAENVWGEFSGLVSGFNLMMRELDRYHSIQLDKLLDEKRKLDLLISLMRDGVLLTDGQYRVLYLNDSAKLALDSGYFDYLFKGKPALGRREKNRLIAQELVSKHAGREAFDVAGRAGGKVFYRVLSETFRPNASGEAVRLIVLRDITMEREIDAMKEDFFNAIAHDLRAPLLGMQGYIKLLEASPAQAERTEYMTAMSESLKRLFEQVESVLEIARMETGTIKLNPAEFSFTACAEHAVDALRPVIEDKKLIVTVEAEPAADTVYGDERLVGRIINNLLSNSIKFTPEGGRITIDCHAADKGGRLIRVSDTGCGIEPDQLEAVFDKYRQTSAGKAAGGYGLGLAIVKTIASLHSGSARAKSAGNGTTIEITLPSKPAQNAPSANAEQRQQPQQHKSSRHHRRRRSKDRR